MLDEPLTQVLILLAAALLVVTIARRLGLPTILGYLIVGMGLGPHALSIVSQSQTTGLLAELGIVFLLFTLGLEFSFPRMLAMRGEVFGLGTVQVTLTVAVVALIARLWGVPWLIAALVGGAIAMSSTAIILHELTDRAELNRTHGRLAFSMLLFQDLAFVPLFALASALARGSAVDFSVQGTALFLSGGALAVMVVLAAGRWLLRPLFHVIAHSRLRELFTLAVLFVVLAAAWTSYRAGLSLALGAFLAGMMVAETEYRHQIEVVIRPFRDILLGLFFISVGMLLDVRLLIDEFATISLMLLGLVVIKGAIAALATRLFVGSAFKAIRTGVVMSIGGEFGIALFTVTLRGNLLAPQWGEPLLVAIVLSMVLSPLILSNNKRIARALLREQGPPATAIEREAAATREIAARDHVILCGFGRVGQNVARVLESQGFEFIALDLDPARIRAARQTGDPVIFGDSADEEMLGEAGLQNASAVVVSFSAPPIAIGIVRSIRRVRQDVPILVRTADDTGVMELRAAGATEVVPETFEASLMLVSQVLMLLRVPVARVVRTVGEIRNSRYALLRTIVSRDGEQPIDDTNEYEEEVKSVVLPPQAWAIGRTIDEARARGAQVAFTGIRRHGILGREPDGLARLRDGDIVVIYGPPEALEHAEAILLAG
ncbi:MAG TPA: cation:proton antiporter [Steroidobacteraceae bacterium]|jgi:CPA2 family monovalent cation:H+ antiporter-2|nr:cation:proton antiporter [Steroidobacteraceae bacterium]